MSTNYHTPIPGPPAQPEATSELFNSRFSSLDSGISGKVDSTGNGSNITSEVSVAGTRRNLTSGGTLKVIFSEIQKWLSDMKAVAFSASYNDLINRPTTMMPTAHAVTHKTGGSDPLKAVDIGAVSDVLPGSNVTVSKNPDTGVVTINAAGGGSGGSAHIIANDGAALPNQGTLDFGTGLSAVDDPSTFKTAVSLDMTAIQIGKTQINDFPAAMTPTAHAISHARGGSDVITPESIGAMAENAQSGVFNAITPANGVLNINGILAVTGDVNSQISIIPLTLKNGWIANAGWGDSNLRCLKMGKLMNLQGMVFNGSSTSNIIGTIPSSVAPIGRVIAPCLVNNDVYRPVSILTDGEIHIGESNKDISGIPWIWISALWLIR